MKKFENDSKIITKGRVDLLLNDEDLVEVTIEIFYSKYMDKLYTSISSIENDDVLNNVLINGSYTNKEIMSVFKSIGVVMNIDPIYNIAEKYIEDANNSGMKELVDYNLLMDKILESISQYYESHIFTDKLTVSYFGFGKINAI